jgi:polysaccharide deacetylase family protein (PEP-CTERM system associated)
VTRETGLHYQALSLDPSVNMLSVDVECWHFLALRNLTGETLRPCRSCAEMTRDLLALFKEKSARATFFVLGSMVEAFPDLVREISAAGHEVATHGDSHIPCFELTPDELRDELKRSTDRLGELTGDRVAGFRAPEFSVTKRSLWVLDVLSELGFRYDSSVFPIAGRRYGIPDFPRGPVRIHDGEGSLVEVPLSTVRLRGKNRPVAGGGYFRLMPYPLFRKAFQRVNRDGYPFVFYCHPYEYSRGRLSLHPYSSRPVPFQGRLVELKYNLFRNAMRQRLERMLGEFRFAPIKEVLSNALPS